MSNILIISNCAISNSESNGRISAFSIAKYKPTKVHNFYLKGIPDYIDCDYITVSPKRAFISRCFFGIVKTKFFKPSNFDSQSVSLNPKSRKPFYHLIRSFAYLKNRSIINALCKYVKQEEIDTVCLWGSNVPFLYRYAWKIQKKCNIKLATFTAEDYPLKDYNFINGRKSFLFNIFKKSLRKHCEIAYKLSFDNVYSTEDLKLYYEQKLGIKGGVVSYFKSSLAKCETIDEKRKIKRIVYGGNLYDDRAKSLLEIASYLEKFKDVFIDLYGNASSSIIEEIKKHNNIHYKGIVPYENLVQELYNSDLLIHIEGFSEFYIKDCKFSFSTKISDYFAIGKPFFVFGPKEISGVKFVYNLLPDFVATNKEELTKLDMIILGASHFTLDYNFVIDNFLLKK